MCVCVCVTVTVCEKGGASTQANPRPFLADAFSFRSNPCSRYDPTDPRPLQAVDKAVAAQLRAALPRVVTDALRDSFATAVVPAFERATQAMFGQMEAALSSGLASHMATAKSVAAEAASALKESSTQVGGQEV